jgi:hypothetical protein
VLDAVVGRQTDFIVAADGRIMHALALIYVVRAIPGVGQFKLIQHAVDRLEVQVVPDARWNETAQETVMQGLRARWAELKIELKLLDAIAPEARANTAMLSAGSAARCATGCRMIVSVRISRRFSRSVALAAGPTGTKVAIAIPPGGQEKLA